MKRGSSLCWAVGCLWAFSALSALGQISWPSNWSTNDGLNPAAGIWKPLLGTNGQFYFDNVDDVTPHAADIVGGSTDSLTNGPYPAGFYYIDSTNIMFRMRLDGDPRQYVASNTNFQQLVWGVYFNTDTNSDVDYILQIDAKNHNELEFATNNVTGGPATSWDVTDSIPQVPIEDLNFTNATLFGVFDATSIDGSHFHIAAPPSDDYFVDLAIPWTIFTNATGLGFGTSFEVALATASDDKQYLGPNVNKDSPDVYWSTTIGIPEPSAGALAIPVIAAVLFLIRRRRR